MLIHKTNTTADVFRDVSPLRCLLMFHSLSSTQLLSSVTTRRFFSQLPLIVLALCVCTIYFNPCLCISGCITISYRCKQWWVSVKVSGWRLKRSKAQAGGLTCSGGAQPLAYSKIQHETVRWSKYKHAHGHTTAK